MQRDARTEKTACTRDCPDACGLIATVVDGKLTRLQGDPDHPVTQGFICHRTSRFADRLYSKERLLEPLVRRSKSDRFTPISWSDALDLLAEKMLKFRSESGSSSILQYRCGGSLGIMKHVGDHFFHRFGPVTTKSGDVCAGAGEAAQIADFGDFNSSDYFDIQNSKTIFLWGKNVFTSSIHLIPELKRARANGTRIILIDPVHTRTTSIADTFVQPRPGSDSAIALGIARWLFENGHVDPNAGSYCDHLERFRQLAFHNTLQQWADLADIPLETLQTLGKAYAAGPTCSMIGWGLQRRRHGAATIRTIDALAAVSGNLGIPGGGSSFYFVRRDAFDFSFANNSEPARSIPEPLLAQGIADANDPPIRMAYVWAANPVAMLPDSQAVADALKSREFTVVADSFFTDTCRCADLILPTKMMLEENDLVGSYGHHYVAKVNQVVDAPANVLSDNEIFRELSRRLGLAEEFDVDESVWHKKLLSKMQTAGATEQLEERGHVRNPFVKDVLFQERRFSTPSGRVNLIHSLHTDLLNGAENRAATKNRLLVTALSTSKKQASQSTEAEQQSPLEAVVHPDAAPNHQDGDTAELVTAKGRLTVTLKFDRNQRCDIALMAKGGWHSAGRSANSLIAAEATDDGECAVYLDTPAEIH